MPFSKNCSDGTEVLHIPTEKTRDINTLWKPDNWCTTNFEDFLLVQVRTGQMKERLKPWRENCLLWKYNAWEVNWGNLSRTS